MGLYSPPPPLLSSAEVKPTLLVCWWITIFCFTMILLRISGRYIRSERLFTEDRTVSLAIVPLFLRMGCVHVILVFGTNNAQFGSATLSSSELHRRAVGSGLVLASRILHAATLWILKVTILEFFKRISDALLDRFTHVTLIIIRYTLAATFVAVIVSDLVECHPFHQYWQVLPDPGGQCRQGHAQLLTFTICNVFTDLLLVFFPIPIIFFSRQTVKRKVQLILLFSLSLGVVGVSIYRVTRVIQAHGNQQLRSLLASVELLFATTAANALVLGSFVRDRGTKKNKFRAPSTVDSVERGSFLRARRPTVNRQWGSDEDLVRDLGLGVRRDLRDAAELFADDDLFDHRPRRGLVRPAPYGTVDNDGSESSIGKVFGGRNVPGGGGGNGGGGSGSGGGGGGGGVSDLNDWQFPDRRKSGATNSAQSGLSDLTGLSDDTLLARDPLSGSSRNNSTSTGRKVSFIDAGGLLNGSTASDNDSHDRSSTGPAQPESSTSIGVLAPHNSTPPSPAYPASNRGVRRGSTALLQDLGGLLGPPTSQPRYRSDTRSPTSLQTVPQESHFESPLSPRSSASPGSSRSPQPRYTPHDSMDDMMLMDPGGLLSPNPPR
ncbi:pth11-like integral membrane protein [Niveomyces insectorum RCEF 264]|uniref:Pth11-like integral membrane protein n=1 Tax=Niveomyces insectorum RCEF 264 TaxID=1081102 RepID=A0A167PIA0_9HYPO|nr:pth11-like integral membrane protein [Niveomyces insectorum RCEF 264]